MAKNLWQSFLSLLAINHFATGCAALGTTPSEGRRERFRSSAQYNTKTHKFENKILAPIMNGSALGAMKQLFFTENESFPAIPLPEVKPNMVAFLAPNDTFKFIWLGHSTFLLRLDGKTILVDPVLSDYASPIPFFFGKRFQPPVLSIAELPDIDIVLISHDHYDHLDMETVQFFVGKKVTFITPLGVGAHLESWGISTDRITELDWWENTTLEGIGFTCTPAQHFSGRGVSRNETLWASWVVQGKDKRVFYSGDSGYSPHYKEIGERLGPFDLAFLESGQYNEKWSSVHQLPEQAIQAHIDLKGNILVPVHWGMFELAPHDWREPIERLTAEAIKKGVNLFTPKIGEIVIPSTTTATAQEQWWARNPASKQASK